MNWKIKALLQRAISMLPHGVSFELYYLIQRACGTLRSVDPIAGFEDGIRLIAGIEHAGGCVRGKTILEVGTGRRINVPLAFWLCGADRTITVDLNPYLKPRLIGEDLQHIRENPDAVMAVFGARAKSPEFQRRFAILAEGALDVPTLMAMAGISYIAPRNARSLPLPDDSIDYHISNNTLEHIPPDVLRDILVEGKRVVKDGGLLVHRVDFSDHFSEVDDQITTVNFLRYSEEQWQGYSGNRYNYHNRLRIDELEAIIGHTGLIIVGEQPQTDPVAMRVIESGFSLAPRFAGKPTEVNATESAVVMLTRGASPAGDRSSGEWERWKK